MPFTFHLDPGHGWLAVPIKESNAVGLHCDAYSAYSYVKGFTLYLEEDCDAPKFLAAYKAKHGVSAEIVEKFSMKHSAIRHYARINTPQAA